MSDFVQALNRAADVWWPHVLHGTWQSSLVAAALLGVVYLGRRLPAQVRYGLILIALAKFAVPATLSMPTGLFSRFGPTVRVSAPQALPAESAGLDDPAGAAGEAAVASPGGTMSWRAWAMILHALGAAAMCAWIAIQLARVGRMARRARMVLAGSLHRQLIRLCRSLHLRRHVRLLVSREPVPPMAFGVLRPSVIIPASLRSDMSPRQLESILAHELAHHRRGDLWVNWGQLALAVVWWFNPMVWGLNAVVRRIREDCCDDLLLADRLTTGGGYCDALLKVAARLSRGPMLGGTPGFAERLHPLGERIKRIMDPGRARLRKVPLAAIPVMVILGGIVLPGLPSETIAVRRTASHSRQVAANEQPRPIPPRAADGALQLRARAPFVPHRDDEVAARGEGIFPVADRGAYGLWLDGLASGDLGAFSESQTFISARVSPGLPYPERSLQVGQSRRYLSTEQYANEAAPTISFRRWVTFGGRSIPIARGRRPVLLPMVGLLPILTSTADARLTGAPPAAFSYDATDPVEEGQALGDPLQERAPLFMSRERPAPRKAPSGPDIFRIESGGPEEQPDEMQRLLTPLSTGGRHGAMVFSSYATTLSFDAELDRVGEFTVYELDDSLTITIAPESVGRDWLPDGNNSDAFIDLSQSGGIDWSAYVTSTPVPDPATIWPLALGLIGLLRRRRRK